MKNKPKNLGFFKDVPGIVQEEDLPFKVIMVHFEDKEDIEAFSKLMGQTINKDTKAIWYPKAESNK